MYPLLPLLLCLCCSSVLSAQYAGEEKFGRVSDEDRALMVVPGDPSAEAYVLYDKLDLRFDYLPEKGPALEETVHTRVKLLKPSSFDRADISIRYDRGYESILNLKAEVHLPDGSSIKIRGRDFVRQDLEEDRRSISFTFPQVTPGCIVEYTYTRKSEHILLPTPYTFQEDIPVRWAEYTAQIPEYYKYVSLGLQSNYHLQDKGYTSRIWRTPGHATGSTPTPIEFVDMRYVMVDLPAFEIQPYTNNLTDYLPKVKLQLQSVDYPNTSSQPVFNSWQTTVEELHQRQDFGRYYQVRGNFKKVWAAAEPVIMAGTTVKERVDAAYYFVASHLKWNERYSFLGSDTPDDVFAAGMGNSADLNLCLLALLNEAGIPAYPLLVSLRDRGAPVELYPLINQFDHLLVYTEVDDQPYLLDANGMDRPPGLPREAALNHRGWVALEEAPQWINVEVPRARRVVVADIVIDAAGETTAELTGRMESYYAFSGRTQLRGMDKPAEGPLALEVMERHPEAQILEQTLVDGSDDSTQPLTYKVAMNLPAAMAAEDYLYVQPILIEVLDGELDDVEERQYPIDFPYPWRKQYIATIHIPKGYVLEEAPEPIRFVSEDGGITATFASAMQPNQTLLLNFTVDQDRTLYQAEDYAVLRGMYRRIIELQETTLVFKRAK